MQSSTLYAVFAGFLIATFAPAGHTAQSSISSGNISGSVRDLSGTLVPNAQIRVANADTGFQRLAVTDKFGNYRVLLLAPGEYDVTAEGESFPSQTKKAVRVTVGETSIADLELQIGQRIQIDVIGVAPVIDAERSQQANTIAEEYLRLLPIDRRDYLSHTLLAPGVVDSTTLADSNDLRVPQARDSGLSFHGNNGRGNSVSIDGGDANNSGGGVRKTLSQEAVQEFQINRANYSTELGGASGSVINIVSKTGSNQLRGSAFVFLRDARLDAADPFAIDIINDRPVRVRPRSNRQQIGATLGGPFRIDRTMFFASFEALRRRESNSVPVLTDFSIFEPTQEQELVLKSLPPATANQLRAALTSPSATQSLFRTNSGVFPFSSSESKSSIRLDHQFSEDNQVMFRYHYAGTKETNPNTRALVGVSRGFRTDTLDHDALLLWTHIRSPKSINQVRLQFVYGSFFVRTNDPFGPEININGFGLFNRDATLPSYTINRLVELSDSLNLIRGSHNIKLGGTTLIRANHNDAQIFFGGRFTFGGLPGSVVSPALSSTTINAVQAFNLGLPQFYHQGFGNPVVASTIPHHSGYFHETLKASKNLTIDAGVRFELDVRTKPIPVDKNNWAPRVGFAWAPLGGSRTVVRGGYGLFYSPSYYQLDYAAKALSDINGHRQIAQLFTTLQTPGPANSANIYKTLLAQEIIQLPLPERAITEADLAQFGTIPTHNGPIMFPTVLFEAADDFENPYSQQASLGIDHAFTSDVSIGAGYLFAHTIKIMRSRDQNLLTAALDPTLGIRVWKSADFRQPLLLQDNLYESSARASYHGLVLEASKRFGGRFSVSVNYTLSKAIDDVVDFNSDFEASDQSNLNAERALSAFDQRHKFVMYGTIDIPKTVRSGFRSAFSQLAFSAIVRANSGRPFNLLAGFDLNGDRHSTTDRPAFAGRNTGVGPGFWTTDLRLTKTVALGERGKIELIGEVFNIFNHLNFQSVNNTMGNISGPFKVTGRKDRGASEPLGFTAAYDPRRIQVGFRISF